MRIRDRNDSIEGGSSNEQQKKQDAEKKQQKTQEASSEVYDPADDPSNTEGIGDPYDGSDSSGGSSGGSSDNQDVYDPADDPSNTDNIDEPYDGGSAGGSSGGSSDNPDVYDPADDPSNTEGVGDPVRTGANEVHTPPGYDGGGVRVSFAGDTYDPNRSPNAGAPTAEERQDSIGAMRGAARAVVDEQNRTRRRTMSGTSASTSGQVDDTNRRQQNGEEFGDFDWSLGLGGPEDEVEQFITEAAADRQQAIDQFSENTFDDSNLGRAASSFTSQVGGLTNPAGIAKGGMEATEFVQFSARRSGLQYANPAAFLDGDMPTGQSVQQDVDEVQNFGGASGEVAEGAIDAAKEDPYSAAGTAAGFVAEAAIGSKGASAARSGARRAADAAPDRPGSFIDDTRGQGGLGSGSRGGGTRRYVEDEARMGPNWGTETIEVERTVTRQADDAGRASETSAADAARQRLPDPEEYESIDAYEREWARATARERFRDEGVSPSELPDWEVEAMERRIMDEWGVEALDDTSSTTRSASATTTQQTSALGTRSVGAAAAGGGQLGGLGAEMTTDPDADTSRTFAPPTFDGPSNAREISIPDADTPPTTATPDYFTPPTTTTTTIPDELTPPTTTTTTTPPGQTPPPTDDTPIPELNPPRTPEFDPGPNNNEEDDVLPRFGAWDKEWRSGILSADEVWQDEFGGR